MAHVTILVSSYVSCLRQSCTRIYRYSTLVELERGEPETIQAPKVSGADLGFYLEQLVFILQHLGEHFGDYVFTRSFFQYLYKLAFSISTK